MYVSRANRALVTPFTLISRLNEQGGGGRERFLVHDCIYRRYNNTHLYSVNISSL